MHVFLSVPSEHNVAACRPCTLIPYAFQGAFSTARSPGLCNALLPVTWACVTVQLTLQVRNITSEGDNAAEALQALLEQQELSVESVVMEETSKPGGGKQLSAVVRLTPPPLPWLQGPDEPAPSADAGGSEGDITKVSLLPDMMDLSAVHTFGSSCVARASEEARLWHSLNSLRSSTSWLEVCYSRCILLT